MQVIDLRLLMFRGANMIDLKRIKFRLYAEIAFHDAGQELVPVMLHNGVPTVVDDREKAEQEGRQGAAAAQQLQPPVAAALQLPLAGEVPALQGAAPERAAEQHGAEKRRLIGVQQNMHGQAAAADDEKSGCGVQHWTHAVAEVCEKDSEETQHRRP